MTLKMKCQRLFRPKISKVKRRFVFEIRQVSDTLNFVIRRYPYFGYHSDSFSISARSSASEGSLFG